MPGHGNDESRFAHRDGFAEGGVAVINDERVGSHQQLDVVHELAAENDVALAFARPPDHLNVKGGMESVERDVRGVDRCAGHEKDVLHLAWPRPGFWRRARTIAP